MIRATIAIAVLLLFTGCGRPDVVSQTGQLGAAAPTISSPPSSATSLSGPVCSATSRLIAAIPSVDDLIWQSNLIVVGTISQQLPSVPESANPNQPMYTDYTVQVDKRFRGQAPATIQLRQAGGSIPGGCVDTQGQVHLIVGDRYVLFLHLPQAATAVPTFKATGWNQGVWHVDAGGVITDASHYVAYQGRPVSGIATQIAAVLSAPQPSGTLPGDEPAVPNSVAPPGLDLPRGSTPSP